jgi:hypothetical protein
MEITKKQAVLVSCTDHYKNRMYVIDDCLKALNYNTTYLTSDFSHYDKKRFVCEKQDAIQLHVREYTKNISPDRILSHRDFARAVYMYLEQLPQEPDLVVCEVPPNFLAKYMAKYKKKHNDVKLVFDLFDLWPETFPFGKAKKLLSLPFKVWGGLRDKNLKYADTVLTECDMYREKLGLLDNPNVKTVYLAGTRPEDAEISADLSSERIELCYLGAINNIIDIPAIKGFVERLSALKPCTVHVIGNGERTEELLEAVKSVGAVLEYHGAIFDRKEKSKIISKCHFGLNIMKPSVCIGLTMKSVDYLSHDLPIINTIPADTKTIVANYNIGLNLDDDTASKVANITVLEAVALRQNVRKVFDSTFALPIITERLMEILQ